MAQSSARDCLSDTMARSLGYWNGLRAAQRAPTLLALDPFFSSGLRDKAIAADVSGAPEAFLFWSIGDELAPFIPATRPNMRFRDIFGSPRTSLIWQTYEAVKRSATPHVAAFEYVGPSPDVRSTRELYLPFRGPDDDSIDDVLVVVEFTDAPVPVDRLGPLQRVPIPMISRPPIPSAMT